ncbi:MAG: glycoside hydrolase family 25 protein [Eubacteriales bacterium]|nr:glycoside hydrolase family 25 protein [Eubacteriales bacterium]
MNETTFTAAPGITNPKKKRRKPNFFVIVLSVITIILLIVCIFLAFACTRLTKETSVSAVDDEKLVFEEAGEEIILESFKERLSSGESVLSLLKDYYPDNIVYVDNGRYIFAEILGNLKKNNFKKENFSKDSRGELTYSENGTVVSHKGIDVSQFQGDIDFSRVKASGVEYAIIRCGYRGYGSGTLQEDPEFKDNIEGALTNDIEVGVYFFTQAVTKEEAVEEADYVIDKIKPYNVTYPVVLDVEEILGDTYRQQQLNKEQLTEVIAAFCERVKEKGYTPMIYGNLKYLIGKVDLTRLESYDKWFAYYDDELYYPYEISMWQYSDSGSVDGISGNVDLNISFKKWK